MLKKTLSLTVIVSFFLTTVGPLPNAHADTVLGLPAPGTMVNLSPAYEPALIKGLTVHKDNPFLFDFIVDTGHSGLTGDALKKEGDRLVKYFFACLTIPERDLWVNLSPYEKDRMVPQALGQTALGRDLLAEDYILKQLTASLIYPEKNLGKEFWDRVYAKAEQMYGTTQIPVNTFNKVWIVADKASVYEHGQTAFVVSGHLKVMLEEDYLALKKHQTPTWGHDFSRVPKPAAEQGSAEGESIPGKSPNALASQIIRQIVLPEIEHEVNTGKNFSTLRQIFNSLILASWYKKNLKEALLTQVYADKSTIRGLIRHSELSTVIPAKAGIQYQDLSPEKIYQQYLKAYKKGVFNYIKEDNQPDGQTIPRKYFSGGFLVSNAMLSVVTDETPGSQRIVSKAYRNIAAAFVLTVGLFLNQPRAQSSITVPGVNVPIAGQISQNPPINSSAAMINKNAQIKYDGQGGIFLEDNGREIPVPRRDVEALRINLLDVAKGTKGLGTNSLHGGIYYYVTFFSSKPEWTIMEHFLWALMNRPEISDVKEKFGSFGLYTYGPVDQPAFGIGLSSYRKDMDEPTRLKEIANALGGVLQNIEDETSAAMTAAQKGEQSLKQALESGICSSRYKVIDWINDHRELRASLVSGKEAVLSLFDGEWQKPDYQLNMLTVAPFTQGVEAEPLTAGTRSKIEALPDPVMAYTIIYPDGSKNVLVMSDDVEELSILNDKLRALDSQLASVQPGERSDLTAALRSEIDNAKSIIGDENHNILIGMLSTIGIRHDLRSAAMKAFLNTKNPDEALAALQILGANNDQLALFQRAMNRDGAMLGKLKKKVREFFGQSEVRQFLVVAALIGVTGLAVLSTSPKEMPNPYEVPTHNTNPSTQPVRYDFDQATAPDPAMTIEFTKKREGFGIPFAITGTTWKIKVVDTLTHLKVQYRVVISDRGAELQRGQYNTKGDFSVEGEPVLIPTAQSSINLEGSSKELYIRRVGGLLKIYVGSGYHTESRGPWDKPEKLKVTVEKDKNELKPGATVTAPPQVIGMILQWGSEENELYVNTTVSLFIQPRNSAAEPFAVDVKYNTSRKIRKMVSIQYDKRGVTITNISGKTIKYRFDTILDKVASAAMTAGQRRFNEARKAKIEQAVESLVGPKYEVRVSFAGYGFRVRIYFVYINPKDIVDIELLRKLRAQFRHWRIATLGRSRILQFNLPDYPNYPKQLSAAKPSSKTKTSAAMVNAPKKGDIYRIKEAQILRKKNSYPQIARDRARRQVGRRKPNSAQIANNPFGGIDLNTANMGMSIRKDANGGVQVTFDPAMIARIRQQGIQSAVPVIINIRPMSAMDIAPLLGLAPGNEEEKLARI